jgi:hypothetical protein
MSCSHASPQRVARSATSAAFTAGLVSTGAKKALRFGHFDLSMPVRAVQRSMFKR